MPSVSTSKANVTKAITAWEAIKGNIPASLFQPVDAQAIGSLRGLEAYQATVQRYLTQVRTSLQTLTERRQALLDLVKCSDGQDADSDAYESYDYDSRVDDAILAAESIVTSLGARLQEVHALIDRNQHAMLSDTPQSVPERTQEDLREHSATTSTANDILRPFVLPQRPTSAPNPSPYCTQLHPSTSSALQLSTPSAQPAVQLGKLVLEPFTGYITKFHRFWCAFELAVHNDPNTPSVYKFLYLQSLLQGEAQVVLQDLDPDECNYSQLVEALKRRYDRPYKTRATLHRQLQQLPVARNVGHDLRNTWFRISGILHGLRKYEDFRTVLPLLDLVKSKFPSEIQRKLHDLEFQTNSDFDLDQVMQKLDNIIASTEKYEDSTTLTSSFSVYTANSQRSPSRPKSRSRYSSSSSKCCFCESPIHRSTRCPLDVPVVVRRTLVKARGLCWKCLREDHSSRECNYPSCRTCEGDHHELLCRESSPDHRQSTTYRHTDDSYHRHRSPRRYSSNSPPRRQGQLEEEEEGE